tara:strand:- start:27 stop:554 length:528 start_codon:yes stop_codon:yes gene_type:complete
MLSKSVWRLKVLALTLLLLGAVRAGASDLERHYFSLVGKALIEIGPFGLDVYQARFFRGRPEETLIELTYLRDVPRYLSLKGWEKGFSHMEPKKADQAAIDWILSNTPDFEEGDRFAMLVTGGATRLFLNEKLYSESESENVGKIIHIPWIGDQALDANVREKLLGGGLNGDTGE